MGWARTAQENPADGENVESRAEFVPFIFLKLMTTSMIDIIYCSGVHASDVAIPPLPGEWWRRKQFRGGSGLRGRGPPSGPQLGGDGVAGAPARQDAADR